jgi:hypothetical protein
MSFGSINERLNKRAFWFILLSDGASPHLLPYIYVAILLTYIYDMLILSYVHKKNTSLL